MSNIWTVAKPTTHMKKLCKELGPEYRIIKIIDNVPQSDIGMWVGRLHTLVHGLTDADFGEDGFLRESRTEYAS